MTNEQTHRAAKAAQDIAALAEKMPFETAASPAPASHLADGETLNLGQINALLAPISINAAGLAELGFDPVATAKAAKLYNEGDFPAICRALAQHIHEVAAINA